MTGSTTSSREARLRVALLETARHLVEAGLNRGATGNVSVRLDTGFFLITPGGFDPFDMTPDTMVKVSFAGEFAGELAPSSEWQMHCDILMNRPEVNAVVHTHSTFASTLGCLNREILPFHYMVAIAGGNTIRCASYALFGSKALSDNVLVALKDRYACLLSHHGMIAIGADLKQAASVALEVEALCEQYWRVLQAGTPILLSDVQMAEVLDKFKTYGQKKRI
jgi:L-fuculose-phosphate aldolase